MKSDEIEVSDREDAACDMDQLGSYFARRGMYEEAAMVGNAARRIRVDDWDVARMTDAIEEKDADLARLTALVGSPAIERMKADLHRYANDIVRLTAERDFHESESGRLKAWLAVSTDACETLAAERDAAIQRAERAERVAVWAADACCRRWGPTVTEQHWLYFYGREKPEEIEYDGTDADLFRALVEACEGVEK